MAARPPGWLAAKPYRIHLLAAKHSAPGAAGRRAGWPAGGSPPCQPPAVESKERGHLISHLQGGLRHNFTSKRRDRDHCSRLKGRSAGASHAGLRAGRNAAAARCHPAPWHTAPPAPSPACLLLSTATPHCILCRTAVLCSPPACCCHPPPHRPRCAAAQSCPVVQWAAQTVPYYHTTLRGGIHQVDSG